MVIHGTAGGVGRAADVDDQLGDALDVLHREARVHATLEAVTGIRRKVEAARAARHRLGPPKSGLDVDVPGVIRHSRGVTAHDACQRFDLAVIRDHTHLIVHGDGIAIEQLELLARLAPAHVQAPMDLVQIKNVRRAAQFEHHVVGDVHQRRHATLTAARQAVQHPLGRGSARVHIAHDAAREATAQIRSAHLHRQRVRQLGSHRRERGTLQRCTGQCRHLTCNAIDAQAMRQIGRELEREQRVVQIQVRADVLAHGRCGIQLQEAAVVFRQLELARRAQHALTFHAAQLAHLDEEGFAVVTGRQFCADQRAWHLDAHARIGRAAHDVEQSALAHIHLAHAQAVGIGVLHGLFDFAHDDLGKGRRHGAQLFDLQAGHGEGVRQLLGAQRGVAEFAQPGLRELHGVETLGLRAFALEKIAACAFRILVSA